MTSRTWLLVGILLALLSFSAIAEESIPATSTYETVSNVQYKWREYFNSAGQSGYNYATGADACNAAMSHYTSLYPLYSVVDTPCYQSTVSLWYGGLRKSDGTAGQATVRGERTTGCPTGSAWSGTACVSTTPTYSCPATGGWTLVGQSCVRDSCAPGEVRNEETGACSVPEPVCNIPADGVITGGYYNVGTSSSGSPPPGPCLSSCRASFEGDGPYEVVIGGVKNYFVKGIYYSTGAVCSPDTPIVDGSEGLPSSSCGPNQSSGTINGKTVCVDNTTNQPVPTDAPKSETKTENTTTNPDGSTTTTTTTNHPDGTSTTETTTTATDGTKTTTVVTNGGESEKPADGSATEVTQKEILDELKKTECEKNPDSFACVTSPLDIVNVDLPESVVNVSITPISVGGAGSCPADHVVDFLGQPVTVSWQLPCQYATGIRPVVLAVAWLSAALILIGAFRQEG